MLPNENLTPDIKEESLLYAGSVRPGITVSISGAMTDAAVVTEVQPDFSSETILITLETGKKSLLGIMDYIYQVPE